MSEYDNVVGGKLRLKGRALDVKSGGIRKRKKARKHFDNFSQPVREDDASTGRNMSSVVGYSQEITMKGAADSDGVKGQFDTTLTAAERRYIEQWEKIDFERMAKMACKSHRDRIHEFNQYLANLSEHHDIPKVGPG